MPATPLARLKAGYYFLTALNAIVSSYYFNYLFFYLHDTFDFGNEENLGVAALHGAMYTVAAWQCGKFAERRGAHTSLKVGFAGLSVCMVVGGLASSATLQIATLIAFSGVLLFIWPALEALTTAHEPPARVPHMIGLYNCTWAGSAAVAYFTGGSLYAWLGKGALFWIPAAVYALQFLTTLRLERLSRTVRYPNTASFEPLRHPEAAAFRQTANPALFLKLAWVANPFSYVAIYTLFALMPALAERLHLSAARAGLFASIWLFGRLAAFAGLWRWTGWHYRFGWLATSYVSLTLSFLVIVLGTSLTTVVIAQVIFGLSCGLIYYSSLFYSMDVGEAQAEHGGLHEAAIGAGIFAGPAVGAVTVRMFPHLAHASAFAVTGLLVLGFGLLLTLWRRDARKSSGAAT